MTSFTPLRPPRPIGQTPQASRSSSRQQARQTYVPTPAGLARHAGPPCHMTALPPYRPASTVRRTHEGGRTMTRLTRRATLAAGLAVTGTALLGGGALAQIPTADVPPPEFPIEPGAKLHVLRPSKFVQGDETLWLQNSAKFTAATGVEVAVDSESWEDLRPKTAAAANVGSGPDVVLAWQEDPHLYADKLVPLDELADYLGRKYGGWFPVAEVFGEKDGRWIAMPVGGNGSTVVYRQSWVRQAGFGAVPGDFPGYLRLCQGLQKIGHPSGLALGNAVGDSGWTYWVLWGFDSSMIDEN